MWLLFLAGLCGLAGLGSAQRAELRAADQLDMPARVDSNSPAFWLDGQFHLITSDGAPFLIQGADQFLLGGLGGVVLDRNDHFPMWIESVWVDSDRSVYAWYHHEPSGVCPSTGLTAPQIGALVSYDGGRTFRDLGLVLTSGEPADCRAQNGFFAGGHGDFSVILDAERRYFYFLFSNYGGDPESQGIAMARMAFEDRVAPAGAVWKYHQGDWGEPGLGGRVTPSFPVSVGWQRADTSAFWGPSVHWNTYLESYVVLMNHACCRPRWPQEGVYVSFNPDLTDPEGWTMPQKIMDQPHGYYPQVIGTGRRETDRRAGRVARFYLQGWSGYEIVFHQATAMPEEPEEPSEPQAAGGAPSGTGAGQAKPPVPRAR